MLEHVQNYHALENIMKRTIIGLCCMATVFIVSGCATTAGSTPAEKRQAVLSMKNEVLEDLYKIRPEAKAKVAEAPGYAVFSDANVNIIMASFGGGYGVVPYNKIGM